MSIVNILGTIDDKIENLNSINNATLNLLKKEFLRLYLQFKAEGCTNINSLISTQISGDWGKTKPELNYIEKTICIRGADIPDFNNCNICKAPIRYILKNNLANKKLNYYDVIIELSGGSPTQSTGRSAIFPPFFNQLKENYICTNFCKVLRFNNPRNAAYCFLILNMWYESGLFFNYEIGTTGLKNLNLEAVLSIDIKQPSESLLNDVLNKLNNSYSIILSNAKKIDKLSKLKQLYLKKFFN